MMRPLVCFSLLLFLASVSFSQTAPAQEGKAVSLRHLDIRRATSKVQVDGKLDEPAWASALVFDLPYEWQPGDNVPPSVKTDFLVTYDDDYLYAAWKAYDPNPAEIRAHLMDRDSIQTFVQDDHVLMMIDTFNDERRGFQFRINPLGVQADAVFSQNEGIEDWSFDMIWASAGRITEEGYVVEIAVPMNQIRFPRTGGSQTWGFDVGRSRPRSVRQRIAGSPHERGNNCILCQVVKVTGFEDLRPGRNLELTPTVTANRFDEAAFTPAGAPGQLESGDGKVEAGLSARWGITPNVSLNAALNPDFSQVEADVAQLNVNERFALFFPEKRPFFLEGIDFFSTPFNAVFTRTIVDPKWGAKVTGKEGANAFGFFLAEDEDNLLTIPTNQQSFSATLGEPVTTGVLRYRRDVGSGSTLGVLYTGREGQDYHNRVGGLDGFARFSVTDTVSFQYLRSDTGYPAELIDFGPLTAGNLRDDSFVADYNHFARNWIWSVGYEDRGPDFRADTGFIPRVDFREARATLQRQFWGDQGDFFTQINVGLNAQRVKDHAGQLTDQRINPYLTFAGPWQSFVQLSAERDSTFFANTLYEDLDSYSLFVDLQPSGAARFSLASAFGDTIDFTNNQPAEIFQLAPAAELKLGRHVNAKVDHTLQRLSVHGGELFEANLSQLRLIYNFNVRFFVRGIFQYLDLQQHPERYDEPIRPFIDPKTQTVLTQLLFSYKLNPQTVLFLGYSDDWLGTSQFDLDQTDRTFFFKIGYAWTW
jgi:uncharacterized protein DUF5916/cellulose/xylan binding protein with CBM9 domain